MNAGSARGLVAIIVNYGTAALAISAVESVLAHSAAEVHLVDNASPGDDALRLSEAAASLAWAGRVVLWLEAENHGFGRGNNRVLDRLAKRTAPPDKVFLLNPDARLENDAINILAAFLDDHPGAAVAGAAISRPGHGLVTAAFRFPGLASWFSSSVVFGPLDRLLAGWAVPLPPDMPRRRVDWVAGAAAMFRFDALREVGFFDPDFFLYYEEVELMWRLRRAGWECWYVPEARVVHEEGAATEVRSAEPVRRSRPGYWYDSRRLYLEKTGGRGRALVTALVVTLGALVNHGFAAVRRQPPRLPRHFLRDHTRHVLWPLLSGRRPG